ncbi:hypothetical protein ACIQMR_11445 [Streptomyces sp. NPDC091376]|uniref:hypothetical protein n=1 Tax=Streptomyces sp. NPDC091376 TaxID=3365994 RepID=UPI00380D6D98
MNSHRLRAACRRTAPLHAGLGCLAVLSLLPALPAAARPAQAPAPRPETRAKRRVSSYLDSVRDRPEALRAFFRALPKGGDLHHHLSGAAPTEFLIRLAGEDGLCVDASMTAVPPPCSPSAPMAPGGSVREVRAPLLTPPPSRSRHRSPGIALPTSLARHRY